VAPVAPIPVLEAGRVTQFEVPFGYTVIRLNMQFIKEEFVPALVDRHFRLEAGDECGSQSSIAPIRRGRLPAERR
jgi:hypothetical protein